MWELLANIVGSEIQLPSARSLELRDVLERLRKEVSCTW